MEVILVAVIYECGWDYVQRFNESVKFCILAPIQDVWQYTWTALSSHLISINVATLKLLIWVRIFAWDSGSALTGPCNHRRPTIGSLRNKSRRQTAIQHGCITGRIWNNKGRLADNKGQLAAGLGPWSLGPTPELPAPGLGPGPDRAWVRAQGSPRLRPWLRGSGPPLTVTLILTADRPLLFTNRPLLYLMSLNCRLFQNNGRTTNHSGLELASVICPLREGFITWWYCKIRTWKQKDLGFPRLAESYEVEKRIVIFTKSYTSSTI